jgi:RNA polymerase sigma-70 factor, ECF subfamily
MDGSADLRDEVLVRRAQDGDRAAMVTLYRRYVNEMFAFAHHQIGDTADAEDVTSATFLRVVDALGTFRGQSSFRTWLYAVARNQVRDHWRRNGRRQEVPLEGPIRDDGVETAGAPHPSSALGRAVLERLPPHYRRVIELRVMDGRSIRDTADELGTSPGNVKVLQHRALQRASAIAHELSESNHDDEQR